MSSSWTRLTALSSLQRRRLLGSVVLRFFSSSSTKAPLYCEWCLDGAFYQSKPPLLNNNITNGVVLFLHGLLGNGKNIRSMVKKTTMQHPNLLGLTMDLRGHGASSSSNDEPHTFQACAKDVLETLRMLQPLPPVVSIVGHSWGGRIALQLAHDWPTTSCRPRVWLLDTVPGVAHSSVHHVLDALDSIPATQMTDKKKVLQLLLHQDLDISMAQWLVSSMQKKNGTFSWGFDTDVVKAVLPEFATHDFHGILSGLTTDGRVDLVRSGQNEAWTSNGLQQLRSAGGPGFHLHLLPNAGHWVHVDDLPGLLDIFKEEGLV